MPPLPRGEGMNATPTGRAHHPGTTLEQAHRHNPHPEGPTSSHTNRVEKNHFLSARTSMRPEAPASRTYGRYAVGPRADPGPRRPYWARPKSGGEQEKKDHTPETQLDTAPLLQG